MEGVVLGKCEQAIESLKRLHDEQERADRARKARGFASARMQSVGATPRAEEAEGFDWVRYLQLFLLVLAFGVCGLAGWLIHAHFPGEPASNPSASASSDSGQRGAAGKEGDDGRGDKEDSVPPKGEGAPAAEPTSAPVPPSQQEATGQEGGDSKADKDSSVPPEGEGDPASEPTAPSPEAPTSPSKNAPQGSLQ